MSSARTLLVGGNDVFLDSVADWVARDGLFDVVGREHDGAAALERLEAQAVDLVLMDVALPDMSGFEVARRIKSRAAAPLVILLSFHDSHAARLEAWTAGADGFVAQSETITRLTPLVGQLLRERNRGREDSRSVFPSKRVPPAEPSE